MKRHHHLLLTLTALAACGRDKTPAVPTGQVAANVGGQEITTADVKLEMGGLADDPRAAAAAQPAALQAVVNRKLLAAAAVERGVDKSPVAAMQLARARDLALIQMLQQSIVARAPKPSVEEANIYIQDNPASFGQRKLVSVDQLLVPQISPATVKQIQPMTRLEQVTALLDGAKIPYRIGGTVIDTAAIEAAAAKQIAGMPVGYLFLTPAGGGLQVSRVSASRPAPLAGPAAVQAAQQFLFNKRVGDQIRSQFEGILKAGQANVRVNPAFKAAKPTPRPAAAPPTP